jgi:subtilisin family serine protease
MKRIMTFVAGAILGMAILVSGQDPLARWPAGLPRPGEESRIDEVLRRKAAERPSELQRVVLWTDDTAKAWAAAESAGLRHPRESMGWVDGFADAAILAHLELDPRLSFVQAPPELRVMGTPSTMGDGIPLTGAPVLHNLNHKGQGVKVCVIDVEFGQFTNALTNALANAPGGITTQSFVPQAGGGTLPFEATGAGNHGTSCLKIVHEMAPGAQLYAARVSTRQDLAQATAWALGQGCKIISASIGWERGNFWSTAGEAAYTPVQAIHLAGGLPVFAAGNEAQRHREGVFTDANGNGYMDFGAGDDLPIEVSFTGATKDVTIQLSWDGFPTTPVDYDLELWKVEAGPTGSSSTLLAQSQLRGNVPPMETIHATLAAPTTATFYNVRVKLFNLPAGTEHRRLKIFVGGAVIAPAFRHVAGSLSIPACLPEAFAVGALHVADWPNGPVASYSSWGPTEFDLTRSKPEMVAPSGVTDPWYGTFHGTSAATPHVAGAAALLQQAEPDTVLPARAGALRSLVLGYARGDGLLLPINPYAYGQGRLSLPGFVPSGYTGSCIAVPAVPQPGQAFTIFVTGGIPFAPLTVMVDLLHMQTGSALLPIPMLDLAVHGIPQNMLALFDGLGIGWAFGGGAGGPTWFDGAGVWSLPFNRPMPGISLNAIRLQAIWLSPMGVPQIATPLVGDL